MIKKYKEKHLVGSRMCFINKSYNVKLNSERSFSRRYKLAIFFLLLPRVRRNKNIRKIKK